MERKNIQTIVLGQSNNVNIDKLFKLYEKDKRIARIFFFNTGRGSFSKRRLVLFNRGENSFEIVEYQKTFGISITNKMYSRETKQSSIIYKDNKFYSTKKSGGKNFTQLTYAGLVNFLQGWVEREVLTLGVKHGNTNNEKNNSYLYNAETDVDILYYLLRRFSWMRFLAEHNSLWGMSLNTIINNKLYSYNKVIKFIFKETLPVCKVLIKYFKDFSYKDMKEMWSQMKRSMLNINSLTFEFMRYEVFRDTVMMANTLDYKVNCKWSEKRLKLEHDNWSREITNTLMSHEDKIDLKVKEIFKNFRDFSGYELLDNNIEIIIEGKRQNHCVATYINKVNDGICAIYRIDDYTLEIVQDNYSSSYGFLKIAQLRGYRNSDAPIELAKEIHNKLEQFNKKLLNSKLIKNNIEFDKIKNQLFEDVDF